MNKQIKVSKLMESPENHLTPKDRHTIKLIKEIRTKFRGAQPLSPLSTQQPNGINGFVWFFIGEGQMRSSPCRIYIGESTGRLHRIIAWNSKKVATTTFIRESIELTRGTFVDDLDNTNKQKNMHTKEFRVPENIYSWVLKQINWVLTKQNDDLRGLSDGFDLIRKYTY
jgi:hypothetical protein